MAAQAAAPGVAVIVVNWRRADLTARCVRSLLALDYCGLQVCVVDNGSGDGSAQTLSAEFPAVTVLALPDNGGYAAGCNAGLDWARGAGADYAWLLNNDTTVDPSAARALVAAAGEPGSPAILAPRILTSGDEPRIWSAGGRLRWPWLEREHRGQDAPATAFDQPERVEWASGCALFFPLTVLDLAGPLDERYFLYLEDVDWCLRAGRKGIPVWYVPGARIWHDVSESASRLDSRELRYYVCRNYYLLAFTHCGPLGRAWAAARLLVTLAKTGVRTVVSPGSRRDSYYHAQTRGLVDFLRGRFGAAPYSREPAPHPALVEA